MHVYHKLSQGKIRTNVGETKKPVKRRVFIVAGAGFEPATSGL